ncbi:Nin-like protein [Undibacterium sp. TJN19]|uniref:Nin-like protein n=1 Tax=Undibacterium sp. TJN19 TaxID=3413055 RepID=UPI003BF10963
MSFKIDVPTVIQFSAGRSSGMMLKLVLEANGGLPDCAIVCFENTGKERKESLDFVQECSERWSVPIIWLEYAGLSSSGEKLLSVVDYATASRNGEPFMRLILDRQYLPNPVARFCTVELKVRVVHRYLKSLGWTEWDSFVGLRSDEQRRVAKLRNQDYGTYETRHAPLAAAGVTKGDVGKFWQDQPFDLQLPNNNGITMHGNCDLCFLKGGNQILSLVREEPQQAVWWMEAEKLGLASKPSGAVFRSDRPSYESMYRMAMDHGELFPFDDEGIECVGCTD